MVFQVTFWFPKRMSSGMAIGVIKLWRGQWRVVDRTLRCTYIVFICFKYPIDYPNRWFREIGLDTLMDNIRTIMSCVSPVQIKTEILNSRCLLQMKAELSILLKSSPSLSTDGRPLLDIGLLHSLPPFPI